MPFIFHALALGLFASLIAPFAGFFASGFKRAFKIKVRTQLGEQYCTRTLRTRTVRVRCTYTLRLYCNYTSCVNPILISIWNARIAVTANSVPKVCGHLTKTDIRSRTLFAL